MLYNHFNDYSLSHLVTRSTCGTQYIYIFLPNDIDMASLSCNADMFKIVNKELCFKPHLSTPYILHQYPSQIFNYKLARIAQLEEQQTVM